MKRDAMIILSGALAAYGFGGGLQALAGVAGVALFVNAIRLPR